MRTAIFMGCLIIAIAINPKFMSSVYIPLLIFVMIFIFWDILEILNKK